MIKYIIYVILEPIESFGFFIAERAICGKIYRFSDLLDSVKLYYTYRRYNHEKSKGTYAKKSVRKAK